MATTTRSKRKQMEQMTKEAEENLIQEVIEVNESDLDSNTETSHLVIQEESEIDPDYEVEDSHVLLQDITTLSVDISNINIDDLEAEFLEISKQSKQPPIKTTRPKTSWVWKFFELNKDNSKALCQISGCSKMLKWCGSPSSLSTHLSGTHGITKDIAMKCNEEELKNSPGSSIIPHNYPVQESLTKNVIGFVVGTVQPLSIVEDPDFIKMINGFDNRYKIPCTKTLKDRISKTFEVGKDTLKNQLTQVEYISLTLDAWSSPAHLPYLGVTAHWITSDFEPYEVLLSIEELPYPHGATEIQEHLIDLFYEWGIESKITAVVTDNGSNVKKACNEIGIGERIPCSAHTLQLSIGKGLDKIKLLVDKCKRLIIFLAGDKKKQQLKESQIHLYRQEILQDDELEKEVENLICLDVIKVNNTRWNSTLYAFQRLIILKSAIAMLKTTLMNNTNLNICKEGEKLEELYPTVYEWKVIKEMIKLLSPFEAATRLLSGVKYPTIGFTYPCICNLKDRLETDFTSLETMDAKHCRNAMLEDLTLRWNYPQELCLKGSFFDPRFKSLDFINSQEECNNIVNQLKEEFMIFKHNEQSDISIISEKNTDELRTEMASFWKKKNTKVAPIKDEFQHYFDVAELPALEEYDPYLWWSTNKNQYPVLHKLAMKYLSIPATSVPSEGFFLMPKT
ncbi:unnamed protein product [Rhizophagus irregularis]|uniref:HAT C-terminal dimerisation domain-containing protein n=2 Tax=Rhizophagus irregularis TaxID=588596 RepID=A0A915ZLE0_9GLOM|nr:unnamed protein product [Rhizophagus irregularis]